MPSLSEMTNLAQLYEESRPRLLAMLERRIDPRLAVRVDAEDVLGEVYLEARRRLVEVSGAGRQAGLCLVVRYRP